MMTHIYVMQTFSCAPVLLLLKHHNEYVSCIKLFTPHADMFYLFADMLRRK